MILLRNGTLIDWKTLEFRTGDILAGDDQEGYRFLSSPSLIPYDVKTLDCSGKLIMKSFANAHHHAYSALARGMRAPSKSPSNFLEILNYIWWNLDKALDPAIIKSSALVTALACAKNGVTCVIDHHASPNAIPGSLEIIASAFESVGVQHLLCYEISDRDGADVTEKGLAETAQYLEKYQGLVGLHASFTVGEDTLKKAVELARRMNSGIHIHVAEDSADQRHCIAAYGRRVVERLSDHGVLHFPKTILGHCLHIDDRERRLISDSPAWVVENMESNLNNSVGLFNSTGIGKNIMLGTDGMHSDMLRSAKAAFFAGHTTDTIDYAETWRRLRNVHHYLAMNGFNGDGENNLVVLDYRSPTPMNRENFAGHFLFGIESSDILHVIANGQLIIENKRSTRVSEEDILGESKTQALRLWAKMR